MKKTLSFFSLLLLISCQNYGKLKVVENLPKTLEEVSGTEVVYGSDLLWMLNDSGNKPKLYGVNSKGKIEKTVGVKAKNYDWEDITSDEKGNIYIGDFGNNKNKRNNLVILKVANKDLLTKKNVEVERIQFSYPNQTRFPPNKKNVFFDAEAFFYWNNYFYIFTKSRVKYQYGKTSLYKVPAIAGNYKAEFISEFNNCNESSCWITAADITKDGKKIVLLTSTSVLVFSNFSDDNFFNGKLKKIPLEHLSQKEGVTFKNKNTLYITDEKAHGKGGKLYTFSLN